MTSYYNLVAAKATIEKIRNSSNKKLIILVGGHAFRNNPAALKKTNADMVIDNFNDIKNLQKENQNEITI